MYFIQNSSMYLLLLINNSPAQDFPNKKKTAAFCFSCGTKYSSDNLQSFDTSALYFVRQLYISWRVWVEQISTREKGWGAGISRAGKTLSVIENGKSNRKAFTFSMFRKRSTMVATHLVFLCRNEDIILLVALHISLQNYKRITRKVYFRSSSLSFSPY